MASSSKMPDKPPVCKQFLRYSCKFASRCKYLHERSGQSGTGKAGEPSGQDDGNRGGLSHERPRPDGRTNIVPTNIPGPNHSSRSASNSTRSGFNTNRSPQSGGDGWGKFADWTARLTTTKKSRPQMRFVWEEALSILEGLDPNLIQNIAKRLVGTNNIGRQYIEQVVNHDYSGSPDTDYLASSVPFLLFITHPEVVNSLSIDREVGTLYNYLYGTNGTRAVQFFGNLAKQLSNESNPTNRISRAWNSGLLGNPPSFSKALASTVECLRHTMRRNQNSGFSEDFRVVAEAFCILANLVPRHDGFYNSVDASLREIIGIHRQLNLIIERPALVAQDAGDNHVMSSFPAEIDFPGYQTSRAKHGMYIIGNAETASSVPMWRDVCQMLCDVGAIGNQLELVCSRHQETQIEIEEPQDFLRLSPEGGCDLPCDKRLDSCGHRCFSKCHSDIMHKVVACAQPCNLLLPVCQHPCQMICSEKCGACTMPVNNFLLPCNHVLEQVECWQTQSPITCTRLVSRVVPACGHFVKEKCWVDVSDAHYKCMTLCNSELR